MTPGYKTIYTGQLKKTNKKGWLKKLFIKPFYSVRYIYFNTSTPMRPDDQETTMDELAQTTHYVLEDDLNQPEL